MYFALPNLNTWLRVWCAQNIASSCDRSRSYFSFLEWRTSEALKQEFERGAVACSADARN